MMKDKPSVLVISSLFPDPSRPIFGIFVKNQVYNQRFLCNQVVIVPVRIFPPVEIWKKIIHPRHFLHELRHWYLQVKKIPQYGYLDDIPVYYPRYSSLPRPLIGTWGWFAYPILKKLVFSLHQKDHFDIIHAHYALPEGVIALLLQKWMKVPFVVSIHGADLTYAAKKNELNRFILKRVFISAEFILANSTKTAQEILMYHNEPPKILIVRLGADYPSEKQISTKIKHKKLQILSVGYLIRRKGHGYVIRSLQILTQAGYDIDYVLVGSGPEEQNLRLLCEELGISEHVHFEGSKTHDEVWSYYSSCDIFVLPAWDEAFGLVYIEALSMGKPVIGCQGEGGPEDLKKLGDCIELVKPQDVTTLANALINLINNPERRKQIGEVGRKIVQKYYTGEQTASNT